MRLYKLIVAAIAALLSCAVSCIPDTPAMQEGTVVRCDVGFEVSAPLYATKSSLSGDDSSIRNVNLFVYRGGKLEWQFYQESSSAISLNLIEGYSYSVYALANLGRRDAPDREQDLHSFSVPVSLSDGMPMASVSGKTITASGGAQASSVSLELVRLMSRYQFNVDTSGLEYGTFLVSSVRLRQVSRSVEIFNPESKALASGDVSDGDYASQGDIDAVNASHPIYLYVPENMQGTLLPSNTDPWAKEYNNASLSAVRGLCSYLEVEGVYTDRSGGMSATHRYKMYLGDDATTNFDVARNTDYTLTLIVSDLGAFRDSWKVERGNVSDARIIWFEPSELTIDSRGEGSVVLRTSPGGVDWHLAWDEGEFASAALSSPRLEGNRVSVSNTRALGQEAVRYLRAESFDGSVSAVCTLHVKPWSLRDYILDLDDNEEIFVEGENRWYMPDTQSAMELKVSGSGHNPLSFASGSGQFDSMQICLTQGSHYGQGSGYVPCSWEFRPASGGNKNLCVSVSYDDIRNYLSDAESGMWVCRGTGLHFRARIRSSEDDWLEFDLGPSKIYLTLAAVSRLVYGATRSDINGWSDDYFCVPAIYSDKFTDDARWSFSSLDSNPQSGSFYLPVGVSGLLEYVSELGGYRTYLTQTPSGLSGMNRAPYYGYILSFERSGSSYGVHFPSITYYSYAGEIGSDPDEIRETVWYEDLYDIADHPSQNSWRGNLFYKMKWKLYDRVRNAVVGNGGHFDLERYSSQDYYLRFYDYAQDIEDVWDDWDWELTI